MKIEVINTGSELMLGLVQNSHLGYLSQQLLPLGLRVTRQHTIPDGEIIAQVLAECLVRSDLIIITGGLGPTSDDITRNLVADHCGLRLIEHPEILEKIRHYFAKRKITPPATVDVQALLPDGALALSNDYGTAPGFYLLHRSKHIICLPGPPSELYPMFEESALPLIKKIIPESASIHCRSFRIYGMGESEVQEKIEAQLLAIAPIEIGYCARYREVDLRLITTDLTLLNQLSTLVHDTFGQRIYQEGDGNMESVVIHLATSQGLKLTTAESCTGGLLAHRLTNVPGSSAVFQTGWVTYSNEAKMRELAVKSETLAAHGAVSAETATEMALGALERSGADLAVSLTGVAGPTGGSDIKPVGTLFLALAQRLPNGKNFTQTEEKQLVPRREIFKLMASQAALDLIRRRLLSTVTR